MISSSKMHILSTTAYFLTIMQFKQIFILTCVLIILTDWNNLENHFKF